MMRKDRVTIKREKYELVFGEKIYMEPEIIALDIPCHLSVSLNSTTEINKAPYILSNFTLFFDSNSHINLKENDMLIVTTNKNQQYKLYAGEIKIYNLTVQVRCSQEKIIEG